MKRLLYLLCAALLCLAPAVWAQTSLRWCLNEVASPPWRLGLEHRPRLSEKGERAQGLEYDFLRLLASRSGLQFQWVQRPWRRCLLELQRGEHDAMMAMSYLPEREPLYRFPMREGRPDEARAIQRFSYYLYVAKGQPSPWDGQQWQLPAGTAVAVPMGYSIATVLRDQGVSVDDSQRGTEEVLGKLVSGQVAVAALPFDEVEGVLKREAAWRARLVRVEPALQTRHYFLVFSHAFANQHPALAERLWDEAVAVRDSAAYRRAVRAAGR